MKHIQISGFSQLERNLKKLSPQQMKSVFKSSLNGAARIIVVAAKNNLPKNYDTLRRSITTKARRSKKPAEMTVSVGLTVGVTAKYDGWYGHMVEYGVQGHDIPSKKVRHLRNRKEKKILKINSDFVTSVNHPGVKAVPFMRPAIGNNLDKVLTTYKENLMIGIFNKLSV